jgi:hypothetical protein
MGSFKSIDKGSQSEKVDPEREVDGIEVEDKKRALVAIRQKTYEYMDSGMDLKAAAKKAATEYLRRVKYSHMSGLIGSPITSGSLLRQPQTEGNNGNMSIKNEELTKLQISILDKAKGNMSSDKAARYAGVPVIEVIEYWNRKDLEAAEKESAYKANLTEEKIPQSK